MIIDGMLSIAAGWIRAIVSGLPVVALPDPGWTTALSSFIHSADAFAGVFPLGAIFVCLSMGALYLGGSTAYHTVMWVVHKVSAGLVE